MHVCYKLKLIYLDQFINKKNKKILLIFDTLNCFVSLNLIIIDWRETVKNKEIIINIFITVVERRDSNM
jgi:hypothetical protein